MLPDFFVIGAQKAGSTYLLQCLAEHPQIYMPPSEVAFFEDSLYDPQRLDWFEQHFNPAQPGQVVGVKRPNLLGRPECPERLHRHMPNLKLVVVLRHPVERAVSGYFHYMKTGFLPVRPVEQGLQELLDGKLPEGFPRAAEVLEFGLYHKHLSNYQQQFPAEQLHITLLDDLKPDPQQELDKLYAFLGVETGFKPPSVDSRPMAAPYSMTRLRLWNAVDRWCRVWSADGRYFHRRTDPLGQFVSRANAGLDRVLWRRLLPAQRPPLPESLQSALIEFYQDDVRRLSGMLGRPLTCWQGLLQGE